MHYYDRLYSDVNKNDLPSNIRDKINFFSSLIAFGHICLGVIKLVAFMSELGVYKPI